MEVKRTLLGTFYTPEFIAKKVKSLIEPFLSSDVLLFDPAGGYGALLKELKEFDYRVVEVDVKAVEYLRKHFDPQKVFHADFLKSPNRESYSVPREKKLIIVANPPYNDRTSLYKKGHKGSLKDSLDRDLGIAFLRALSNLKADVACIVHPMSYLIKKTNFNRLREWRENYALLDAYVFPSFAFQGTSRKLGFPVLIALYAQNSKGTTWQDVLSFEFKVLNSSKTFKLRDFQTTDRIIAKYPRKGLSDIGLYFPTFRDLNSLLRNKDFLLKPTRYALPVNWKNLPKYAYLVALKHYIKEKGTKNFWLYGNFPPLINEEFFLKRQNLFLRYVVEKTKALPEAVKNEIKEKLPPTEEPLELVEKFFEELHQFAHAL